MVGLIIRSPWVEHILEGRKIWEIRGFNTKRRGRIALIKGGSSRIVGTCELIDVRGPLSLEEMLASTEEHLTPTEELIARGLPYGRTYAWVLAEPRLLEHPIPYKHPNGAITWVKLFDFHEYMITVDGGAS